MRIFMKMSCRSTFSDNANYWAGAVTKGVTNIGSSLVDCETMGIFFDDLSAVLVAFIFFAAG